MKPFTPIYIEEIKTPRDFYFEVGLAKGGLGTKSDPYVVPGGNLDVFFAPLPQISPGRYIFGAGVFYSSGFRLPWDFTVIQGRGMNHTTIKLASNVLGANLNHPHLRLIADYGWCSEFGIRDITLDGNWDGQEERLTNGNFKIEPVVINAVRGKYERVRVINFGSHGSKAIHGDAGMEAFPMALQTCSMGTPFSKYSEAYRPRIPEVSSFIEISSCEVSQPHFIAGGYCTGIFLRTNQSNGPDRMKVGERDTLAGWVHDCKVSTPGGIAFGCGYSEGILFENNTSVDSKCGFNCDAEFNRDITIRNNTFIRNSYGLNFGPSHGGDQIEIRDNVFTSGEKTTNPITGLPEGNVGISVNNVTNATVAGNTLIGPSDWEALKLGPGVVESGNRRIIVGGEPAPSQDPSDIIEIEYRIAELEAEKVASDAALVKAKAELTGAWSETERVWGLHALRGERIANLETAVQDYVAAQETLVNIIATKP